MAVDKTTKDKQNKHKDKETNENEGDDKNDVCWSLQMEHALANIMRDKRQHGNKEDGGWKKVSYNNAASTLSAQFNTIIVPDNVRNRVKTWKRFYGIVIGILSQSVFTWDATSKMITVDSEHAWEEYIQFHKEAKSFCYKVIPNTGHGAETGSEATQDVTPEDDHIVDLDGDTEAFEGSSNNDEILTSAMGSQTKRVNASSYDISAPKKRNIGTKALKLFFS